MDKLNPTNNGSSMNIVQDNIQQLKQLFPDVFTEGKVDFDLLKSTLGEYLETNEERYNFNWHGKSAAKRIAQTPSMGTLRPCKEESNNWDTTQNLFIEGDNLEALKLLQKSYHKQVNMIYIDPPYNTGKEFIYPDNYQDNLDTYLEYTGQKDSEGRKFGTNTETTGRYHTNWLNMMSPRLKLARNLLCDDGMIFISIDDNEQANLKKLCDEIFGESNFVNSLIWKKRYNAAKEKHLAAIHEYVLIYSKNIDHLSDFLVPGDKNYFDMYFKEEDEFISTRGRFMTQPLEAGNSMDARPNLHFPIIAPDGTEIWPRRQWVWGKDRVNKAHHEGRLKLYKDKLDKWKVRHKQYERDDFGAYRKVKPFSIYDKSFTQDGTKDIEKIFNKSTIFSFPKPIKLIKHMLELSNGKSDLILDFFSGSCSTAHAVMDLNAQDNGNRKHIMVQLPELCDEKSEAYKAGYKTIADIGKERIRRAGEKIFADNADKEGIENLDIGFKVFKLDSSNIKAWDSDLDNIEASLFDAVDNIKPDRSEDDVLYELLLKYGIDLTVPIEQRQISGKAVYSIGFGALIICLADDITLDVVEGIGKLKQELAPELTHVVFKDSGLKDDVVKTNAIQILKRYDINDVKTL